MQVCVEYQCLRYVRDLVCHINGTFFNQAKIVFVHYSIANSEVTCANSSGSAFMGYVPSPLTTHTAYLIIYYT